MRFHFSSPFLRVQPPDTTFGEAWESLCLCLLALESPSEELVHLRAPDRGIDILNRTRKTAFQCKSTEAGAGKALSPTTSLESLETAHGHRESFGWQVYCFATNADYSGGGVEKILQKAAALGLEDKAIAFQGPSHWEALCSKHFEAIRERFAYRVTADEMRVLEALRRSGLDTASVAQTARSLSVAPTQLVLTNDKTPIELELAFSLDLSAGRLLQAARQILGLRTGWRRHESLGAATALTLSLRHGESELEPDSLLADHDLQAPNGLSLRIAIRYRDERRGRRGRARRDKSTRRLRPSPPTAAEVRATALARAERTIQDSLWAAAAELVDQN